MATSIAATGTGGMVIGPVFVGIQRKIVVLFLAQTWLPSAAVLTKSGTTALE